MPVGTVFCTLVPQTTGTECLKAVHKLGGKVESRDRSNGCDRALSQSPKGKSGKSPTGRRFQTSFSPLLCFQFHPEAPPRSLYHILPPDSEAGGRLTSRILLPAAAGVWEGQSFAARAPAPRRRRSSMSVCTRWIRTA
jgi:hypothetical protein